MPDETISLIIGLIGAVTGLIAVCWTIWQDVLAERRRIRHETSISSSDGQRLYLVVVVTNIGRSTILLDAVSIWGLAVGNPSDDLINRLAEAIRQRREMPRHVKRALRRIRRRGSGEDEAIRLEPRDAKEFRLPIYASYEKLSGLPGEWWGAAIHARDGKEWRISGDALESGEREWIPYRLRSKLPRILRLRWWRYRIVMRSWHEAKRRANASAAVADAAKLPTSVHGGGESTAQKKGPVAPSAPGHQEAPQAET